MNTNEPRRHHHVPQLLLNNFCSKHEKKSNGDDEFFVHVFDKKTEQIKNDLNVKNVMCETDFHRFKISYEGEEFWLNYERLFHSVEGAGGASIKKLIEEKNLTKIDDQDKVNIAAFITFQFFRTKQYRALINILDEAEYNLVKQFPNSGDDDLMERDGVKIKIGSLKKNENQMKETVLKILRNQEELAKIASHLLVKKWILYETDKAKPFYISDAPVTLHNDKKYGPYGNIGFAVPGIEIYFPISSTLTLGMICPLLYKECQEGLDKIDNLKKSFLSLKILGRNPNFKMIEERLSLLDGLRKSPSDYFQAFNTGLPVKCGDENIKFLNSRQVINAERFVACSINDFGLVKQMIQDDAKFKKGAMSYSIKF